MIRIRYNLFLLCLMVSFVIASNVNAQSIMGARGTALGGATTALYDYSWSIFSNPAHLNASGIEFGFYGIRNYGFSELTDISSFATLDSGIGVVGVGIHRYGDDLYSESRFRAGYKYEWERLHVGMALNYTHIAFANPYGSGGAFGLDVGLAAEIGESVWLAAKSTNVNQGSYDFGGDDESLPRELSVGVSYSFAEKALFLFDVVKDVRFPVAYRSGVEVEVVSDLVARVGVTTEPTTYTFGMGYSQKNWEVNLVIQRHSLLGNSPGLDIIFNL